jgi:GrpB-like predicted nucleotidyltransferase (UPF0157 family)
VSQRRSLQERLRDAGVQPGTDPVDAWRRLRAREGGRTTVIDLYEMIATPRGLAPHQLAWEDRVPLIRSIMGDVWPGFEQTAGSERRGELIRVVDYDEEWPQRFVRWREVLKASLGEAALRIEHVGSTSVAGLAAKPVVDIQVSVADPADEAAYVPPLEELGLQLRSRDDVHRFFRPVPERPRDVHLHVCAAGSDWERDHLLFRDYLRAHPEVRERYADVKRDAAKVWADDGWAYTDAKSDVILDLLEKAREEAQG